MSEIASKGKRAGERTQIRRRNDLDHWARLEAESQKGEVAGTNGRKVPGKIIRKQALEWLRLESIRLAYRRNPQSFLRMAQKQDHDLRHAFGSMRDRLINWPPRWVSWVYPYTDLEWERSWSFYPLALDEMYPERLRREHRSGRVIISLDPTQSEHALNGLRQFLTKMKNGKRARGAGPTRGLLRLREALLSYEKWLEQAPIKPQQSHGRHIPEPTDARDNVLIRTIGESLVSYPTTAGKGPHIHEKRAQEILQLAREMLRTASPEPGELLTPQDTWSYKYR